MSALSTINYFDYTEDGMGFLETNVQRASGEFDSFGQTEERSPEQSEVAMNCVKSK